MNPRVLLVARLALIAVLASVAFAAAVSAAHPSGRCPGTNLEPRGESERTAPGSSGIALASPPSGSLI